MERPDAGEHQHGKKRHPSADKPGISVVHRSWQSNHALPERLKSGGDAMGPRSMLAS